TPGADITGAPGPGGGSALCGPNGTNACNGGQQCDATLGCVECTTDPNCPATAPFCITGKCEACRTNADCGTGATPACWPGDHKCHAACVGNASCPKEASLCTVATGICVGCNLATDCPATASICHAGTQQCVQCEAN